jgi:nucleotide-binding universal stress UspA family protein/predicted transcriptional regulator
MMPRVILVPLDGSEEGEAALPSAVHLARDRHLDLVLLRVAPLPTSLAFDGMGGMGTPILDEGLLSAQRDDAAEYLASVRERLTAEGVPAETIVREGNVEDHILDIADELGAHFIALATHGRGGIVRFALGSLTERMLQHATVPLLLVRIQDDAPPRAPEFKRILVPLDGSPLAEGGLDVALEVADAKAELLLLSIQRRHSFTIPLGVTAVTVPDDKNAQQIMEQTNEYLDRIADGIDRTSWSVQTIVRRGDPAQQILEAARDHDVDLIVLSTYGHTGPARWLHGSVADQVVRASQRPVVLASARSFATRAAGDFTVGDIMSAELTTVRVDESLGSAIRKLLRRGLNGAPVVDDDGRLVGVLSENEVLAWQEKLIETPAEKLPVSPGDYARLLEEARVGDVMASPAPSVEASAVLSSAIAVFREHRVRPLPVTNEGELVGVIRRADVLRAMTSGWQSFQVEEVANRPGSPERVLRR